jgi:ribosomal protein L7/L12
MKVIVTQPDLEKMVRANLGVTGMAAELTVVFDSPTPQAMGNYIEGIHRAMYENPRYATDQKIQAIKRLRELVPGMGLAQAKMAIENTQAAIAHFIRNGSFYQ